jgi:hypothetical protein
MWMNKERRMKWLVNVIRLGQTRGACRFLVGKCKGKRPVGRPRHRWEDNVQIFTIIRTVACSGLIWLRIKTSEALSDGSASLFMQSM